jgi:N-acetylmuramoyl-L-alanine amidase
MSGYYVAQSGDCLSSIAFEHGFEPDTLWHLDENRPLRELRQNPHALAPGDRLYIPDLRQRVEHGATGQLHRFVRKAVPEVLRVQLMYDDEPRKNEEFTIEIDGKLAKRGRTGGDGVVLVPIIPNARAGRILFADGGEEIALQLGRLQPVETPAGAQARLQNLGYFHGEADGTLSDALEAAIVCFQADHDLEPSGELDAPTRSLLVTTYGG